ncbi:MAG: alcohol dehydrogenase catalytic domain-containing protein [Oscillospiraceae bacterium]|nr:alcohol dehydrogenase catalytic domain-containing protein [Oscillospiraceae bacterium]
MLSYVYRKNSGLALEERENPALGAGAGAVIKVSACSVCGTDIRTYRFGSGKITDGQIIGHEAVGLIVELSDKHKDSFSLGDRVAVAPAIGCGYCASCVRGRTNMCDNLKTIGFDYAGGLAGYMAVPDAAFRMGNVYRLPESPEYSRFTLSEPLACAINGQSFLHIQEEDDVVIFGSGVIGCFHAELAYLSGAGRVVMIEPSEQRRQEAGVLVPGVKLIDPARENIQEAVTSLFGGKGADAVIVACSAGSAQAAGLELLAKHGRISLFGGISGDSKNFLDSNLIHYRELSVYGAHASTPEQNRQASELIVSGSINAEKYITGRYPLTELEKVFEKCSRGEILKAVIVNKD